MKQKSLILLIEDDTDLKDLYTELLTGVGYEVISTTNGNEGLELIKTKKWDLLLLDIMLPGQDGLKILKNMESGGIPKIGPILVITNFNTDYIIKEAFKYGADAYLLKADTTPDKVLSEVKRLLDASGVTGPIS